MDTAELVCLIIILIILVVTVVLSCTRCWGSVTTIVGEASGKPTSGFTSVVADQLRRSFRRATTFWGNRTELGTTPPQTIPSVSVDVIHGSDLHPVYLCPRPHQTTDSPPRYEEVVRKPDTPPQPDRVVVSTAERDTVNGFDNPAYADDSAESGDVATFNKTYIQLTNSGVVFPDDERKCVESESYI